MSHSIQKILIYSSIVSISLILAYLLFSKSNGNKNKLANGDASTKSSYSSGRDALQSEKNEPSLFDTGNGFLEFSNTEEEQNTASNQETDYDPAKISPEEREKRRKLAIEKFKPLVATFPNNRYIPREKTVEELTKEKKRNENMDSIQDRILSGDMLTSDESLYFYSEKKQELTEKIEILTYAKEKLKINPNANSVTNDILARRFESIQSREVAYNKEIQAAKDNGGDLKNFSED